jgi:ABC-2 type transport system ATP-binding protein
MAKNTTADETVEPATSGEAITVENVRKTFDRVVALDDVSLTIEPGQYHCLLGPNGSGKSTLLRLVLKLARPDEGTIGRPEVVFGCSFQQPNFYPDLSVRENIDVFTSMVGADDQEWNQTVVDELRLNDELAREASDLSGGYARKLDLALALVKEPDFLFLDEPLAALDDVSKTQLLEFLDEYTDTGHTVVVSSHYVEAFEPYLDHVTLMHDGDVLFDRAMENIDTEEAGSLQDYYVQTVLQNEDATAFEQSLVE